MPPRYSDYATMLMNEKIQYVPPCVMIEIVSSIYGYILRIPVNRRGLEDERARIVEVVEMLHNDVVCTFEAYESGRVRFFTGDWKTNRLAAQRIFEVFIERLKKLHYFFWGPYHAQLKNYIGLLEQTWTRLYTFLDERCRVERDGDSVTRYLHSSDNEEWQRTMANIIADLYEKAGLGEGERLMLLCCGKVKARIINQIEQLQMMRNGTKTFDGDCILCVSQKEVGVSCPLCMRLSDTVPQASSKQTTRIMEPPVAIPLHPAYQAAVTRENAKQPSAIA